MKVCVNPVTYILGEYIGSYIGRSSECRCNLELPRSNAKVITILLSIARYFYYYSWKCVHRGRLIKANSTIVLLKGIFTRHIGLQVTWRRDCFLLSIRWSSWFFKSTKRPARQLHVPVPQSLREGSERPRSHFFLLFFSLLGCGNGNGRMSRIRGKKTRPLYLDSNSDASIQRVHGYRLISVQLK